MPEQHDVQTIKITSLWADPHLAAAMADRQAVAGWRLVAAYVVESHLHMLFAKSATKTA